MNLLIVEDDIALLETIIDTVRLWGHGAEWAVTGQGALQKVKDCCFDLILLDIFLPDIKGHQLISEIKKIWPKSNIISMTGYNSRDLEMGVRKQGVIYHMIKPFDMDQLRCIVDHINKKRINILPEGGMYI